MFYLVLQYNVSCFIKEVIMKDSFCTENQKILEMKITQKCLPRQTIEILEPGMMKREIMVKKSYHWKCNVKEIVQATLFTFRHVILKLDAGEIMN